MQVYAEAGFGNKNFLSTEYEDEETEHRQKGFTVHQFISAYARIWIGTQVYIIDTQEGIKHQKKRQRKCKLIIGIHSHTART